MSKDKECGVCVHTCIYKMEYYSAIRQKILLLAATWTDFEGIMLSKVRQIL